MFGVVFVLFFPTESSLYGGSDAISFIIESHTKIKFKKIYLVFSLLVF